jgi:hypothetical protein
MSVDLGIPLVGGGLVVFRGLGGTGESSVNCGDQDIKRGVLVDGAPGNDVVVGVVEDDTGVPVEAGCVVGIALDLRIALNLGFFNAAAAVVAGFLVFFFFFL